MRWEAVACYCQPRRQSLLQPQALGDSYKWMLYGDDDTLFFVDAVLDLLLPYDPELPYAISDNIWFEANSAQASHHDSACKR